MTLGNRTIGLCGVYLLSLAACRGDDRPDEPLADAVPPPECAALWQSESAAAFAEQLVRAITPQDRVWADYGPADGAYVLNAGTTEDGATCLGLWRRGRAVSYTATAEPPKRMTPLYGYYLTLEPAGGVMDDLAPAAEQPESVRSWLERAGVASAVIMPVKAEGFPFEIPTLHMVQIAIHEGFHVAVQMPRWLGHEASWPAWDRQPERSAVGACYGAAVEPVLQSERDSLERLVTSLLDGDGAGACPAGEAFLSHRAERYRALVGVEVPRADGSPGDCREAEDIMELEEGVADYASWPWLYDHGIASREDLLGRYRAQQSDVYYLTGAMQLHAIALMRPGEMGDVTREIAASTTPAEGGLTSLLRKTLAGYCPRSP